VLLQQGKGAVAGATFGGGNSNTMFGASGADTLLTKVTTTLALGFMLTSIVLAARARPGETPEGTLFTQPVAATSAPAGSGPADEGTGDSQPAPAAPSEDSQATE